MDKKEKVICPISGKQCTVGDHEAKEICTFDKDDACLIHTAAKALWEIAYDLHHSEASIIVGGAIDTYEQN